MPRTNNENLIFGTQAERLTVVLDSEQLMKDTTSGAVFVGDGSTTGGHALDVRPYNEMSADYTLVRNDEGKVLQFNSGTAFAITIPLNSSVAFPTDLTRIPFVNIGTAQVTFTTVAGVTVNSPSAVVDTGESGYLIKTGTDTWFMTKGNVPDAATLSGLTDVSISSVSNGQVLTYDASSGKWKNQSNADVTYALSIPVDTTKIRLTGSDGTTDDITITGGSGITITRTTDSEISIAGTVTDTSYTLGSSSSGANASIDLTPNTGSATSVILGAGNNITLSEAGSTITLNSIKYTDAEAVSALESEAVIDLTGELNVAGDFVVDSTTFKVDSINNRVGVLNTSPATALDVGGTIRQDGASNGLVYADSNGDLLGGRTITAGTGMTVSNGDGVSGNPTISTTITQYTDALAISAVEGESTLDLTGVVTISQGLTVDTNTLVVDSSNNRVGIATTSPSYPLDVTGDVNLSGDLRIAGTAFDFSNLTSYNASPSDGQVLKWNEASSKWIAGSDVNTNTTYDISIPSSTTKIRLAGSDGTNDDITVTGGTNVTVTRVSATELSLSSTAGFVKYTDAEAVAAVEASDLTFSGTVDLADGLTVGSGTPKDMVVDVTNSRTGINVDAPTEALDVLGNLKLSGNAEIGGNLTVSGTTTTVNTDTLSVEDPIIFVGNDNTANLVDLGYVGKYQVGGTVYYSGILRDASASRFRIFTTTEDLSTATSVDPTNAGFTSSDLTMGGLVATTLAGTTLDLTGALTGTSAIFTGDLTVDTNTMKVDSTNNRVGIKTASPSVELDVIGTAKFDGIQIGDTGETITRPVDNELAISTGGSERVRIDSTGKFGIGVDPTQALDVSGSIKQTGVTSSVLVANSTGVLSGVTDGSNGQMLTTDGGGNFSFTTATGTYTNSQAIAAVEGTSSLDLTGTLTANGSLTMTHAGTDIFADIIGPSNRSLRFKLRDNGDADAFKFLNLAGTELVVLQRTGHLGVGVTDPAYHVDVGGDINYTGTLRKSGVAFGANNLADVNITSVANGNILVYDSSTSKWVNQANTDANTTYDFEVLTGTTKLRLAGSDGTNDDVTISGGSNVTVTRVSAGELSIASVDTNTIYTLSSGTSGSNATIDLTASGSGSGTQTITLAGAGATTISETGSTITVTSANTTYDLTVPSGGTSLRLTDGSTNDDVAISGGGDTTVTRTSATELTVSSTKYTDAEAVSAVEGEGTLNLSGIVSMASDLKVDTDTLFVDVSADKVGINTATPAFSLDVDGTARITGEVKGQASAGYALQTYDLGGTGTGLANDWFKVCTWTATAQYQNFSAHIRINGRGNSTEAYYDLFVAAEFGTVDVDGWWTRKLDLFTPTGVVDSDTFKLICNDGVSGGASATASLYYKRGNDWDNRILTMISHYRSGATWAYQNSNVGETTPTNDGGTYDFTNDVVNKTILNNVDAITFGGDLSVTGTNKLNIADSQLYDDGDNLKVRAKNGLQLMAEAQYGAINLYTQLGVSGDSNDTLIASFNYNGDFKINGNGNADAASLLFVDWSADKIGIGTNAPTEDLHVYSDATATILAQKVGGAQMFIESNTNYGVLGTANDLPLQFNVNNSAKMYLVSTGRLGIGTSTPATALDVNGWITTSNGIIHSGDTNNTISFGTDTQSFNTAGSTRLHITSAGDIGIGTTSPSSNLEVAGNTTGSVQITIDNADTDGLGTFALQEDGTTTGIFQYRGSTNGTLPNTVRVGSNVAGGSLAFTYAGGTTGMYIKGSDGKVGIGTTSPDALLHVDTGSDSGTAIIADGDIVVRRQSDNAEGIRFNAENTVSTHADVLFHESAMIAAGANMHFAIDSDGSSTSNYYDWRHNGDQSDTGSALMRLTESGRLGIGTTSPSNKLHVESADEVLALFKSTDAGAGIKIDTPDDGYAVVFFSEAGTNKWSLGKLASNSDKFSIYDEVNNAPRLVIDTSGNVGIGTTSPVEKLGVNGNIRIANNGQIKAGGTGYLMLGNTNNGLVTIGGDGTDSYISAYANHLQLKTTREADNVYIQTNDTTMMTFDGGEAASNVDNFIDFTVPRVKIAGAYGSASQVMRMNSAGTALEWGTIATATSTTINNNADNRVITGSNTANTLEGESSLTFASGTLQSSVGTSVVAALKLVTTSGPSSATQSNISIESDDYRGAGIFFKSSGSGSYTPWFAGRGYASTKFHIGSHASQSDYLANSDLSIDTGGKVGIGLGTSNASAMLHVSSNDGTTDALRVDSNETVTPTQAVLVSGSTTVDNIGASMSWSNVATGQVITGTGVPANTKIVSFDADGGTLGTSYGTLVMSNAASASGTISDFTINKSATPFVIAEDGRLGIGTSSPVDGMSITLNGDNSSYEGIAWQVGGSTKWKQSTDSSAFYMDSQVGGMEYSIRLKGADDSFPHYFHLDADNNDMRVGVGTNSPSHNLHIVNAGNAEIVAERSSGTRLRLQSQASAGIIMNETNHKLQFGLNESIKATINTDGSFGVGTTSPLLRLAGIGIAINHATQSSFELQVDGASRGELWATSSEVVLGSYGDNKPLKFRVSNVDRVSINNSGMTVNQNLIVTGDLTVNGTTTTVNTDTLSVEDPLIFLANNNSSDSVDIGVIGKYVDTETYYSGIFRDASEGTKTLPQFNLFTTTEDLSTSTTVDKTDSGFALGSLNLNYISMTGSAPPTAPNTSTVHVGEASGAFQIQTTFGNIKIGPQSSSWNHITGSQARFYFNEPIIANTSSTYGTFSSYSTEDLILSTSSGTKKVLKITDADSYVGIGTLTPVAKLQVVQPDASWTILAGADVNALSLTDDTRKFMRLGMPHYDTDEQSFSLITGDSDNGVNRLYLGGGTGIGNAATQIYFRTAANATTTTGTSRMTIASDGKVGIGTESPTYELDVVGSIGIDDYIRHNGDDNTYILLGDDEIRLVAGNDLAFHYDESGSSVLHLSYNGEADVKIGNGDLFFGGSQGSYDGRMGIGTTTPATLLHLKKEEADSENLMLTLQDNSVNGAGDRIGLTGLWNTARAGDIEFDLVNASSGESAIVLSPSTGSSTTEVLRASTATGVEVSGPLQGTNVGLNVSGQLAADIGGVIRTNMIPSNNWTLGTGSVGIWIQNGTGTENERVLGTSPFGEYYGDRSVLWQATNEDVGGGDGGFETHKIPVDNTKTYRFTMWVKQADMTGGAGSMSLYLGTRAYNSSGSNVGLFNITDTSGSSRLTNPYFASADDAPVADKWYLVVGYVVGHADASTTKIGGWYDGVTGKKEKDIDTSFRWASDITHTLHRAYAYYYDTVDANPDAWWWQPRMELCDGTEPSIPQLLGRNFLYSKDAETMFEIQNDSSSANANATLRLASLHGSDTWVDITENTYGIFSIYGGASTRRGILKMTDHDTDTGNLAFDPDGIGYTTRIGSTGTGNTGFRFVVGNDIGINADDNTNNVYMSVGGAGASHGAGITLGEDSTNYTIFDMYNRGGSYGEKRARIYGKGDDTAYYYMAMAKGSVGVGTIQSGHTDASWDEENMNMYVKQAKTTGLAIESTSGGSLRFMRHDTGLTVNEVVGKIEFYSNDTNDTNVNASISAYKDNGGVSYAPMAISLNTGTQGTIAERIRVESGGRVLMGNVPYADIASTDRGSNHFMIASQTANTFPMNTLEYKVDGNSHYVHGGMKTGATGIQFGSFDSDTQVIFKTDNTLSMKIGDQATHNGKVLIGNSGDATHRLSILNDGQGAWSYAQWMNATTGVTATDGLIVGIDGSSDAVINHQESSKVLKVKIAGTTEMQVEAGAVRIENELIGAGARPRRIVLTNAGNAQTLSSITNLPITWVTQVHKDSTYYTHSTSTDSDEITIVKSGYYEISYNIISDNTATDRKSVSAIIRKDGTEIPYTKSFAYSRGAAYGDQVNCHMKACLDLDAGDVIQVYAHIEHQDSTTALGTVSGACSLMINGWPETHA